MFLSVELLRMALVDTNMLFEYLQPRNFSYFNTTQGNQPYFYIATHESAYFEHPKECTLWTRDAPLLDWPTTSGQPNGTYSWLAGVWFPFVAIHVLC